VAGQVSADFGFELVVFGMLLLRLLIYQWLVRIVFLPLDQKSH